MITKNKINKLKLIGKNEKDLKVMSAYLQDSIILVKNMVFYLLKMFLETLTFIQAKKKQKLEYRMF